MSIVAIRKGITDPGSVEQSVTGFEFVNCVLKPYGLWAVTKLPLFCSLQDTGISCELQQKHYSSNLLS